ncbi:Rha family transcriptional regulator [Pseudomonas savastanoi pv. phaseolicola]|uniref:Anti-repressor protein n=2 Tax=Pseudomonas savastanoi TaxID=29438 RepID=Q48J38_PSE14|nr:MULTISPECIES: Rha family transcriptional regulator [Pseudomonas]AAZ36004.1 Anti-repressor protein [Pseudomonas savastanoi pv. phaseolicola 1448A]KPB40799.1 Anti-repressor protein [Pseudomonas savastanoi pv. phaseolicola]KPB48270.1 Anti-repressor protein [Pseudomonas savastanoi pv. phaseolicola]KPB64936.1 Anti-repressor protein [Pseudomonas savastanoi pv. phaseolicola]KPB65937.1 Anti-repressor protein [Pseudomonas amygdali pv. mellea]
MPISQHVVNSDRPRHEIAPSQNVARTMSSREIADLTGSTHDNVLKTVRSLIEKGVVSRNDTPYIPYTHPQNGQVYFEFLLSYRDTMVVVSGYSVELRAKIIDRWQDLEQGQGRVIATL